MTFSTTEFAKFESLVNEPDRHMEMECGDYLHHACAALVYYTPTTTSSYREQRNFFGSSDFVITASIKDGLNTLQNVVYIWEIKAPQCFIMERDDNKNRYRPTKDLIKAENQLIHYGYLAQQDDSFRQRFGIINRNNIKLGGIIIGRSTDRLAKDTNDAFDVANAKASLAIREQYFYAHHQIRLLTWDLILDFCRP